MNNHPNREVAVFNAALQLPATQRADYLNEVCADDAELRRQVEILLLADKQAGAATGTRPVPRHSLLPAIPFVPFGVDGSCSNANSPWSRVLARESWTARATLTLRSGSAPV